MKYTPIDSNTRVRRGSNTGELYDLPNVQPGDMLEGTEIFEAPVELRNKDGVYQFIGDKWLHVVSVNGEARDGWTALIHKGDPICREVADEQPPVGDFPQRYRLTEIRPDGSMGDYADYERVVK